MFYHLLQNFYHILIQKQENNRTMTTMSTKIASKYMLGPKIGSGSFGQVFVVNLIGTSQIYALKREDEKSKHSQIIIQYKILKQMENVPGFVKVYWHGTENKFNLIVMDMLGPSLEDLFELCGKNFSLKTTLMLADQMLQRIQQLHNRNYVHRDIKPQNFLMGINRNSHIAHLIDFGLSKKYRDSKTHQHIPYKQNKNLTGTARYASINAHLGIQQSRRDDLQAIGYVILYFRQGFLPWQGIKANNKNQKYLKIMEKKMSIPIEVQCKGLPLQISTFLNYCRSLKFQDKPDYLFLRRMLRQLLEREGHKFDYCYDWTTFMNDKKLDNGKIKIELKGLQPQENNLDPKQIGYLLGNKEEKKVAFHDQQINILKQSQNHRKNAIKTASKTKIEQEELLLLGQQNIDDQSIQEQNEQDMHKRIGERIDLEEKKNRLYDNDQDIME